MAVLGKGTANGGCSLLHAAGLNIGATLALDLPAKVTLIDKEPRNPVNDPDGLLNSVIEAWTQAGHKLPVADELHWVVRTKIPPKQGLKSSAAVGIAALKALCEATESVLPNSDLVEMCANAQIAAGITLTGSVDDAWAAIEPGWKLVDPTLPAAEGLLLEGWGPIAEDWRVMIITRESREQMPDPEAFAWHQQGFQQALNALEQGNELVAITWNGRMMAAVTGDAVGRHIANDAAMQGARSAGISGSGPAIVIFVPANSTTSYERIMKIYGSREGFDIIETKAIS